MHMADPMESSLKEILRLLAPTRTDEAERVTWHLFLLLATQREPTQSRKPLKEVPLLKPLKECTWNDFPTLISEAVGKGAIKRGGFLVDVPPSTSGYNWKQPEGSPKIVFSRPRILRKPNGPLLLETDALPTYTFDLKAHLVSWPRHPTSIDWSLRAWDAFDELIATTLSYDTELKCPPYATNCDAATPEERRCLGLSEQSPLSSLTGNLLSSTCETYAGIHTPEAFVSTGLFTPFGAHQEDAKLVGVNYLVVGAPKLWIVIPERDGPSFEQVMISRNNLRKHNRCDQFVRHSYSFLLRYELEEAGIEYSLIWQQQHQAVVVLPGVYHFGINMGPNIAEAVNYDEGSPISGYVFCSGSTKCPNGPKFISAEGLKQKCTPMSSSQPRHPNILPSRPLHGSNTRGNLENGQPYLRLRPAYHSKAAGRPIESSASSRHPPRLDLVERSAAVPKRKKRPIGRDFAVASRPSKRRELPTSICEGADKNPARISQISVDAERCLQVREQEFQTNGRLAVREEYIQSNRLLLCKEEFGTNDIFIKLQDIIKTHRETDSFPTYADCEGLTISTRLKIVQNLDERVTYFELLKRCHLVEVYRQISTRSYTQYEWVEKPVMGNPDVMQKSKLPRLLLTLMKPGLQSRDLTYKSQLGKMKRLTQASCRWHVLASKYGIGVLALTTSLNWATDKAFVEELQLLGSQGEQWENLAKAAGDLVNRLFKADGQIPGRFGLEDWSRDQILHQPYCSEELLSSLKIVDLLADPLPHMAPDIQARIGDGLASNDETQVNNAESQATNEDNLRGPESFHMAELSSTSRGEGNCQTSIIRQPNSSCKDLPRPERPDHAVQGSSVSTLTTICTNDARIQEVSEGDMTSTTARTAYKKGNSRKPKGTDEQQKQVTELGLAGSIQAFNGSVFEADPSLLSPSHMEASQLSQQLNVEEEDFRTPNQLQQQPDLPQHPSHTATRVQFAAYHMEGATLSNNLIIQSISELPTQPDSHLNARGPVATARLSNSTESSQRRSDTPFGECYQSRTLELKDVNNVGECAAEQPTPGGPVSFFTDEDLFPPAVNFFTDGDLFPPAVNFFTGEDLFPPSVNVYTDTDLLPAYPNDY